jgi:hypothetical protein
VCVTEFVSQNRSGKYVEVSEMSAFEKDNFPHLAYPAMIWYVLTPPLPEGPRAWSTLVL